MLAPAAREVGEGTRQGADQYLGGGRGLAACVAAAGDSCCSLEVDMPVSSWVADSWKEEVEDLEGGLQEGDTHDTVASGRHNWGAWERRRGLPSSSWTAGSGSLHPTCRSWWWT